MYNVHIRPCPSSNHPEISIALDEAVAIATHPTRPRTTACKLAHSGRGRAARDRRISAVIVHLEVLRIQSLIMSSFPGRRPRSPPIVFRRPMLKCANALSVAASVVVHFL